VIGVHFHVFVVIVHTEVVVAWPRAGGWGGRGYLHDVEVLEPVEARETVVQVDAAIAAGIQGVLVHPVLSEPGSKVITCENWHLLLSPLTLVTIHRVNLWVLRFGGLGFTNKNIRPAKKINT
jgi:hypothetical protein